MFYSSLYSRLQAVFKYLLNKSPRSFLGCIKLLEVENKERLKKKEVLMPSLELGVLGVLESLKMKIK